MAVDNSVIFIPPVMSVSATQKIDVSTVGQQVIFNNGVFLLNSSLNKTLPKSLYKIWKKDNKLYLIERETTNFELSLKDISNRIANRSYKSDNNSVEFLNGDGTLLARKFLDSFELGFNYSSVNNSNSTISNALKTINPYTKDSTLVNYNSYSGKALSLYQIKPNQLVSNLQFTNPTKQQVAELTNINLFLRLKSIFSNKEITQNYYNDFVYLFSNWCLFNIDNIDLTNFEISSRASDVKTKVAGPLKEQDLVLKQTILINNSNKKTFNNLNVEKFENVRIYDSSRFNPTQTIVLDGEDDLLFRNERSFNYIDRVFVLVNKENKNQTAIKVKEFYSVGDSTNIAFSYTLENLFNSIGGSSLAKAEWSRDRETRLNTAAGFYDVYVYNQGEYPGFFINNNSILELEIEESTFRINSEGDFYVVEIVW